MNQAKFIVVVFMLCVASGVVFAWSKLLLPDGVYTCDSGGGQIEFSGFLPGSVSLERSGAVIHGELREGNLQWPGDATGLPKRVEHSIGQRQILLSGMSSPYVCR